MIGAESSAAAIRQAYQFLFPFRGRNKNRRARCDYTQHDRLLRIFFRFYLVLLGGFALITCLAHLLVASVVQDIDNRYAQRFMRGTFVLIEAELYRHERKNWPQVIEALNEKFAYRLRLVERARLPDEVQARMNGDSIIVSRAHDEMYHALPGDDMVLALGPFAPAYGPELALGIPLRLHTHLSIWVVFGVAFALALFIWVRPVFRDLEALRQTAHALGEGRLEARTPSVRNQIFAPLTDSLNSMADRIQHLIATQKELTSAMSHELRTPIARLRFAGEMACNAHSEEERRRLSEMMKNDLDELEHLIDTSLTYARLERNTLELYPETVNLMRWLMEEAKKLRPLLSGKTLRFDLRELAPEQTVMLDTQHMARALGNLVRNAARYARQHIEISAGIKNQMVFIHVDDDGIGIPEEKRKTIFSAFSRLNRACDRATDGYGLGLAITCRILTLHHGHASAKTSPLGGARFSLEWPVDGVKK
ncbi:MAG: two-component sensor histidine kinase [Zoogloeaceae bacterium]|jgi:two-component system sensor histidine kinase RstB|nr:two-component sensor histidine kinase [Zoogloeaceae bacterium]